MLIEDFMKELEITEITNVGVVQDFVGPADYLDVFSHPVLVNLPLFAGIAGKDTYGRSFIYLNLPALIVDEFSAPEDVDYYMMFQRYSEGSDLWVCNQTGSVGKFEEVLERVATARVKAVAKARK